jgi:HlyD family secretion protein
MKKWIIIGIVAVIVLGVVGFLLRGKFTKKEPEDPTAGIRTATVERGDIDVTIDATGTIQPLNIVEVSSKASGRILELTVDAGDYVEKDELIASIETTYVDIDLEQAQADLRAARARFEQAKINITLAIQQSAVSIQQAEEKHAESQKQLEQLKEQIRIEKLANKRQLEDAVNSFDIANLRHNLLTSDTVRTEDLKRAEASAAQAKSSLELAQKEFDRKENLFAKKYISQADLDDAKAKLDSAQAQHDSAVQQVALVQTPASEAELALSEAEIKRAQFAVDAAKEQIDKEKYRDMEIDIQGRRVTQAKESLTLARANAEQITIRRKDLDSADAQVKRSESGLRLAKESLSDTEIRAPISGTILEKQVEEGQVIFSSFGGGGGRGGSISSEGQVLVTMADLSKVYVLTEVDETDIGKVKVGQLVTITVEAYPDQPYEGEVLRIAPQGQVVQNITTFEVITQLSNTRDSARERWGGGERGGFRRGGGEGRGFRGGRGGFGAGEGGDFRGGRSRFGGDEEGTPRMRRQRPDSPDTETSPDTQTSPDTGDAETPETESEDTGSAGTGDPWDAMLDNLWDEGQTEEPRPSQPSDEIERPFLKPGMNATVQISAVNKQNVLVLSKEAILSFRDRKMVRVIGADGQPGRPQPISTGVSSFDKTEIISGLEEGQAVSIGGFGGGGSASDRERFRRMMNNPAATMRRMQGGFGGRGGGRSGGSRGGGRGGR